MSCSAPIRDQIRVDSSSGIRTPLARSQTQPRMSVSQERYSKAVAVRAVRQQGGQVLVHRRRQIRAASAGAQPITCSSSRTSASGFRYSSEKAMPDTHVEHVADGRAAVAGVRELRDVVVDRRR